MVSFVRQETNNPGENMETGDHFCTFGGNARRCNTLENRVEVPWKDKNRANRANL